jgi:hypothetical protein
MLCAYEKTATLPKELTGATLIRINHLLEQELYRACLRRLKSLKDVSWSTDFEEQIDHYKITVTVTTEEDNIKLDTDIIKNAPIAELVQ